MRGLSRAIPFTAVLMTIGALSLRRVPATAGFFSKDEILGFAAGAAATSGSSSSGATSAQCSPGSTPSGSSSGSSSGSRTRGALARARRASTTPSPSTRPPARKEDTDVGFPEQALDRRVWAWPMAAAMWVLGALSVLGGYVQVRESTS